MVLRKVAGLKRGKLSLYSGHLEQTGFIGQLKSQISELYQYGITPDMLRDVRGRRILLFWPRSLRTWR